MTPIWEMTANAPLKVFVMTLHHKQEVKCRLSMDSVDYAGGCVALRFIFSLFVYILAT